MAVDRDLEQVKAGSPLHNILLARKASLLSQEYELNAAKACLAHITTEGEGTQESKQNVNKALADIRRDMKRHKPTVVSRTRTVPELPEGVKIIQSETGEMGLAAARDYEENEIVFSETPLAVAAPLGACLVCMRPLRERRGLTAEGEWLENLSPEQVEELIVECGLPHLSIDENCCSDECRDIMHQRPGGNIEPAQGEEPCSALLAQLPIYQRKRILASLLGQEEEKFVDEPETLSEADKAAWRTVRKNSMEVMTTPMGVVMDMTGVFPALDEDRESSHGSALYLVASLINHHCTKPNIAPSFLDCLKDTPFLSSRPIKAGEELFFDYAFTVDHPKDKRIRNFLAHRFVCRC